VSGLRKYLAYRLVAAHGLGMFIVFAAPLQFFLLRLAEDHLRAALAAGGLMVAAFVGVLLLAPRWMQVAPRPPREAPLSRGLLRFYRAFVGNGDAIQAVARWIDPQRSNPYAGRSPKETARWLASMELMHWAALAASIPPMTAAFIHGYTTLGSVYLVANLFYNLLPNIVIRDTRRRLLRITQRTELAKNR